MRIDFDKERYLKIMKESDSYVFNSESTHNRMLNSQS